MIYIQMQIFVVIKCFFFHLKKKSLFSEIQKIFYLNSFFLVYHSKKKLKIDDETKRNKKKKRERENHVFKTNEISFFFEFIIYSAK